MVFSLSSSDVFSDVESNFEVIDPASPAMTSHELNPSMEDLSLGEWSSDESVDGSRRSQDHMPVSHTSATIENTLLRQMLTMKDAEIDRLNRVNEQNIEAFNTVVHRYKLSEKRLQEELELKDAELAVLSTLHDVLKNDYEADFFNLNRRHAEEIVMMEQEMEELACCAEINDDELAWRESHCEELSASKDQLAHKIEMSLLRQMLTMKDAAFDRLTRVNEGQRAELEALKDEHTANLATIADGENEIAEVTRELYETKLTTALRTIELEAVDGEWGVSHKGTSIDEVIEGEAGHLAGLQRGDQLISINGVNVEFLSTKRITELSHQQGDRVTLVVRFNPERLADLERCSSEDDV